MVSVQIKWTSSFSYITVQTVMYTLIADLIKVFQLFMYANLVNKPFTFMYVNDV